MSVIAFLALADLLARRLVGVLDGAF